MSVRPEGTARAVVAALVAASTAIASCSAAPTPTVKPTSSAPTAEASAASPGPTAGPPSAQSSAAPASPEPTAAASPGLRPYLDIATIEDPQFAGYVVGPGSFSTVTMRWIEPSVTCPARSDSGGRASSVGIWAGIQDAISHLEQAGTVVTCTSSGVATHRAFWEAYPLRATFFPIRSAPGHRMYARVEARGSGWSYLVKDLSTGAIASASHTGAPVAALYAEWLVERGLCLGSLTKLCMLPSFVPVVVLAASMTVVGARPSGITGRWPAAQPLPIERIQMFEGIGGLATTSSLRGTSSAFSVSRVP